MNKLYQLIFVFSLLQFSIQAQNIYKEAILSEANKSATAQQQLDVDSYMDLMHPSVIEMGGGKELMKDIITSQIGTYSQMGVTIESVEFDDPSDVVKAGDELHCTLSGTLKLKLGEDEFDNPINLLAASQDKGDSWKFIDLSFYNGNSLQLYLPDFNSALVLPQK
jgi:hypothetical protein